MRRRAGPLETVAVEVPEAALEAFERALSDVCDTVGFFLADEERRIWRVEGVRDVPEEDGRLQAALLLAAAVTGLSPPVERAPVAAEGWLERTREAFPDQAIGRRFLIRGTHSAGAAPGRIALTLDAGVAFGSGEHGSTRGCLRALEGVAHNRPRRILDLGTGSGILAMAAAALLRRPVLATDIEPWSVRVARRNAAENRLGRLVRVRLADGWHDPALTRAAPYDLVLANILARPLCAMAPALSARLAPGGSVILAGLLLEQARMVAAAHRRVGLVLVSTLTEGRWATLLMQKPDRGRAERRPRVRVSG